MSSRKELPKSPLRGCGPFTGLLVPQYQAVNHRRTLRHETKQSSASDADIHPATLSFESLVIYTIHITSRFVKPLQCLGANISVKMSLGPSSDMTMLMPHQGFTAIPDGTPSQHPSYSCPTNAVSERRAFFVLIGNINTRYVDLSFRASRHDINNLQSSVNNWILRASYAQAFLTPKTGAATSH